MSQADFSCAICYELAADPVVSRCGHLFCWQCLERWLHRSGAVPECPVCRGRVDERVPGDIIPLYGKGKGRTAAAGAGASRPASAVPKPPRPAADRAPQPPPRQRCENNSLSIGIGSSVFFFTGNGTVWIMLITLLALYRFTPWRAWGAWASEQLRGALATRSTRAPRNEQRRQAPDPREGDHAQIIQMFLQVFPLTLAAVYFISCIITPS